MNSQTNRPLLPFHPFLISLYPALALLAYNIKEIEPSAAYRALLVSFLFVAVVFLFLWAVTRSSARAALVSSLFAALFFSYGHVYAAFKDVPVLGVVLGKQSILSVVYLILLWWVPFWWCVNKRHPQPYSNAELLCGGAGGFAAHPDCILALYVPPQCGPGGRKGACRKTARGYQWSAPAGRLFHHPGYLRQSGISCSTNCSLIIRFLFGIGSLGFVVTRCSQSNYVQTELSLSSTLNLDYLPEMDPRYVAGYQDRSELPALIKQSRVRRSLQELGYRTISFGTGYSWSEIRDADIFYYPGNDGLLWLGNQAGLNQFEAMFIRTTGSLLLTTLQSSAFNDLERVVDHPYQDHINIQLFVLDTLQRIPEVGGHKFIFAHLLIPHGPFVFGPDGLLPEDQMIGDKEPDGNDLQPETFAKGYVPQVQYINERMIPILKSLIEDSATPPIIIVQGDHGPFSNPSILNAYYLPENKDIGLYSTITPVNSFRLIFNAYFGTDYELLPDVSYSSTDTDPFGGEIYPNPCPYFSINLNFPSRQSTILLT